MVKIAEADEEAIRKLSRVLLKILENKNGEVYQENVAKFGIPEEYVRKVFSEERMLKARNEGKATFYLVIEEEEIIGFAQTVIRSSDTVELDRIVIFPQYTKRGIGTMLLRHVLTKLEKAGFKKLIVNAGKEEIHARRFYEKNGFNQVDENTIDAPWGGKLTLVTYQLCLTHK